MRVRYFLVLAILALLGAGPGIASHWPPECLYPSDPDDPENLDCPRLFPAVHCVDERGQVEVLEKDNDTGEEVLVLKELLHVYLSVTNQCHVTIIPNLNFFIPGNWVPVFSFEPGTHVVQRMDVLLDLEESEEDRTEIQYFLGCEHFWIIPAELEPRHFSCNQLEGPQGEPGPEGPPGADAFASCAKVEEAASGGVAVASCPEGSVVVAGGGECDNTLPLHPVAWEVGQIQSSFPPDLTSWQVTCRIGHATAHAICCEAT